MRIVGGNLRGRKLVAPRGTATRPTTDRTRESLFNILNSRIDFEGIRVLDLFAGTGALGLESLSRGASFALFVEVANSAQAAIRANIENLDQTASSRVMKKDATALGPLADASPFDLVFADPPYGKGLGEKAAASIVEDDWIIAGGLFVLEERNTSFPESLKGFDLLDLRQFGDTSVGLFQS